LQLAGFQILLLLAKLVNAPFYLLQSQTTTLSAAKVAFSYFWTRERMQTLSTLTKVPHH
jgi:hypothetical protein